MNKEVMDDESAWMELERFAEPAGLALDERAQPGAEKEAGEDESEVSDYSDILRSLREGRAVVDTDGVLTFKWRKAPMEGRGELKLDPNNWHYGSALVNMEGAAAVSKAAKQRQGGSSNGNVAKLYRFLELLSGESPGTMQRLTHKRDCMLALQIGNFLLSE